MSDYFTKPLQGRLFYKLRDIIMNVDPSSVYYLGHRSVLSMEDDDEDPDGYDNTSTTVNDENTADSEIGETANNLEVEDHKTEDSTRRNVYKTGRSQYTYAMAAWKGLEKG